MPNGYEGFPSELELLRTLLNHVRSAVIATDLSGAITHWNRYAEHLYQWKASEVFGKNIIDVTVPLAHRQHAANILGTEIAESGFWEGEFLVQRKDGNTFPAFVTDSVIRDKDGAICGFVGVSTDITEQKRAQDEIRSSRERLQLALQSARMVAWEWNTKTGRCDRDGDVEDLFGVSLPLDAAGFLDLIYPDDRARVEGVIAASLEGQLPFSEEYRLLRPDGTIRWVADQGSVKSDSSGAPVILTGVIKDITSRKDSEAAAKQSESRLQFAIEAAELGIWDLNLETLTAKCSARHYQIFGYESGTPCWSYAQFIAHVHADDRQRVETIVRKSIAECVPCQFECRIIRSDKSCREIWAHGTVQCDSGGKAIRLTGVIRDITQQNLSEEQFRQAQKLESIGILAGGMAHDFNNLLVGIMGNASLAANMLPEFHPAEEMLVDVIRASERAAELTRQLLAYAGKAYFQMEALDLAALVQNYSGTLRGCVPGNVAVRFELGDALPAFSGDPKQIQQILTNLVLNGAEAIGDRQPGIVTIVTRAKSAAENRLLDGPAVCLEVRDNGCGMPESIVSRIFDPFFTTKFLGRGLGLAAVQGIVRAHKGHLSVTSSPHQGSAFTLLLPCAPK